MIEQSIKGTTTDKMSCLVIWSIIYLLFNSNLIFFHV